MKHLNTYYLYHHQPNPLPLDAVEDQAWLINNSVAYSVVAVIDAPSVSDAFQAAQCKAQARTLPRSTTVRVGNLFRETLPGDVLVTTNESWMVDTSQQVHKVSPQKGQKKRSFEQRSTISDLAWSPNGRILAVAENNRRVVLWDLETRDRYPAAYSRGEYAAAKCLAWSPDGMRLASAGSYSEVHIWRPAPWRTSGHTSGYTGSILICGTEEADASYEYIRCLAWTAEGNRIVAGREDGYLISWDANTGFGYRLQKRHEKSITALAFAPYETHLLLTASTDTTVQIWDCAADHECIRYQHAEAVTAAVWSPDGSLVASCERNDPTITLWHPQTGEVIDHIPLSIYTTQDLTIEALAWSPDGAFLAAGCDDGTIQLVDLALHQHIQTYWSTSIYQRRINALAWSPDSTMLASGGTAEVVDIWQVHPSQDNAEEIAAQSAALVEDPAK